MNELGKMIRRLREKHAISQKEMAKALNVSATYLNQIEIKGVIPSGNCILKINNFFEENNEFYLCFNMLRMAKKEKLEKYTKKIENDYNPL